MTVILKPKLSLKQAADIAGKTPETVANYCKRYGIGRQLHSKAPWAVDPLGLAIVIAGDRDALWAYQEGARDGPLLKPYLSH